MSLPAATLLLILAIAALLLIALGRRSAPTQAAGEPAKPSATTPAMEPGDSTHPAVAGDSATKDKPPLSSIGSWAYQLQNLDIREAAASPFDLLVVDYSRDGSNDGVLTPSDTAMLQRKPDGSRRLVLAYLSIGEAESYRYYWDPAWKSEKPRWLLSENPDWEGNFTVCYWDADWQRLMCGDKGAYLDRIISAGFDGVYLDKCDAFEDVARRAKRIASSRPDLEGDMVAFIARLANHARARAPGFLIIMQNAEGLLAHEDLRAVIDGVAKEELMFGLSGGERRNAKADIEEARRALDRVKAAGKTVLAVEYLEDAAKIAEARTLMQSLGFILYVAPKDRELGRLSADRPAA